MNKFDIWSDKDECKDEVTFMVSGIWLGKPRWWGKVEVNYPRTTA